MRVGMSEEQSVEAFPGNQVKASHRTRKEGMRSGGCHSLGDVDCGRAVAYYVEALPISCCHHGKSNEKRRNLCDMRVENILF